VLRFRRTLIGSATALVVALAAAGCVPPPDSEPVANSFPTRTAATATPSQTPTPTPTPSPTASLTPTAEPPAAEAPDAPEVPPAIETPALPPAPVPVETIIPFNNAALSIDDPASLWVVSNKLRPLNPLNWSPPDLVEVAVPFQNPPRMRAEAGNALATMFAAAVAEGAGQMQVQSAWRSYDVQVSVYAGWVARLGQAQADAQSARPGHSEHQTGLVVDISPVPLSCALDACFGATPQGQWLAANAWRYGYLLRYPADKTPITGFTYEPWHFRYIGVELAAEMHNQNVTTLEEFFGLPAAPDYAAG